MVELRIFECISRKWGWISIASRSNAKEWSEINRLHSPSNISEIETYMAVPGALIDMREVDSLTKIAIVHPFCGSNGRTERIIRALYLVVNGLLDLPIL